MLDESIYLWLRLKVIRKTATHVFNEPVALLDESGLLSRLLDLAIPHSKAWLLRPTSWWGQAKRSVLNLKIAADTLVTFRKLLEVYSSL